MPDKLAVIRLMAAVLAADPDGPLPQRLCTRAMASLAVDALAVTVLSPPDHRHVVCASDDEVMLVEDVQFTSGDGPVVEAYRDNRAVLISDLPAEPQSRWPLFGEASSREPRYAGAFAFPLTTGTSEAIGVMGMYTRRRRRLDDAAIAEAQVVAHAMTLAVLQLPDPVHLDQPGRPARGLPGRGGVVVVSTPETAERGPGEGLGPWDDAEQVVHQAVGMVVAQLRVSSAEALARLRAHAFADATTLDEVATAVVERRLRLEV